MHHLWEKFRYVQPVEKTADGRAKTKEGGRGWEDFYRGRWSYDKTVRTTHGVNCTGSCSWNVYVKDGLVTWENQNHDYPETGPDMPDFEPRGCPRGASFSWYLYSPLRVKYPYVRGELIRLWREARPKAKNALEAWKTIAENPEKSRSYKEARGMGGFVRTTWNEISELIAASLLYTVQKYGPDRNFGFSVIPAMSMLSYAAGARFINMMGGAALSFYDWYADLPPASPQVWGDQTDSPESSDWYNAGYIITWGSNVPLTRTPDAHFLTEVRYKGTKVVSVSPDYAESTTAADTWLNLKAGSDGALAMAMGHVILREYYFGTPAEEFLTYAKKYTDMPFLVRIEEQDGKLVPDRLLDGTDMGRTDKHAAFQYYVIDEKTGKLVVPNGTLGDRWGDKSKWNLREEDRDTGAAIDPRLSLFEDKDDTAVLSFPYFGDEREDRTIQRAVPVKTIKTKNGPVKVTTVFDLIMANYGIDRGLGGEAASSYDDDTPYTPTWQQKYTGLAPELVIRTAREFADNAIKTHGRSMIIMGGGINHWYHADIIYRTVLNLLMFTGCEGKNGGGWAHYVGQEKLRPVEGWQAIMTGNDWQKPPRLQNSTSFFYFATDQWRSEEIDDDELVSPLRKHARYRHPGDYNVLAARLGWLPSYPTFNKGGQAIRDEAKAAGCTDVDAMKKYVAQQLKDKKLRFAVEDPDAPENFPRNLFVWRANLITSSSKGHEYFLKYLLGTKNGLFDEEECEEKPQEIQWRGQPSTGKLDLLIDLDFRMAGTALYSDIVLPTATWYEKDDLSSTDMHPFVHPFQAAVNCSWDVKSDWDIFMTLGEAVSKLAKEIDMKPYEDIVAMPIQHDTEGELAQPQGKIRDWSRGECEPIPGKTMPQLVPVTRDYQTLAERQRALGPNVRDNGAGTKGCAWPLAKEYAYLQEKLGVVTDESSIAKGMPSLLTARNACEAVLALSTTTNGAVAVRAWEKMEGATGLTGLTELAKDREADKITFDKIVAQPQPTITSPSFTGSSQGGRRFSPFTTSIEQLIPFRTNTGRQQYYLDHEMMAEWGEQMATFKPILSYAPLKTPVGGQPEITLKYLTPHNKWSTHSMYFDSQQMLTLFRGGQTVWLSEEDAKAIGVKDNDWVELYNKNGVVTSRAVVSPRLPRGIVYMHHAQDRHINVPGSPLSKTRGGTHNTPTRIHMKPTHMIGGYGQLSYGFNYYGPTGNQRDQLVVVRKMKEVDWLED